MRVLGTLSPEWDFLLNPFSQDSGNCARGGRKIVKASGKGCHQGGGILQTQMDWHTYECTETMAAVHGACTAQWGPNTERLKWTQYIPNQEAISNKQLLAEEKFVFSIGVLGVYNGHMRVGPIPRSRWSTQNKLNSNFVRYCYLFVFIMLFLAFFFFYLHCRSFDYMLWLPILCF